MSESDEGKSKTFYWLRAQMLIAQTRVRTFRKALEVASEEYRQRQQRLQAACPHLAITECKWHVVESLNPNYTDEVIPTRRRCGDCGLLELEKEGAPDRKLFARVPNRTVTPEEFSKILQDALL
jgi:hypothetical protein